MFFLPVPARGLFAREINSGRPTRVPVVCYRVTASRTAAACGGYMCNIVESAKIFASNRNIQLFILVFFYFFFGGRNYDASARVDVVNLFLPKPKAREFFDLVSSGFFDTGVCDAKRYFDDFFLFFSFERRMIRVYIYK